MKGEKVHSKLQYEKINKEILNWVINKEKFLSVISVPYNSSSIFLNTIIEFVKNQKTVLYITNEPKDEINIVKCLKKYTCFKNYSYIMNENQNLSDMSITNCTVAVKIRKKFDLVIYDDISSYSNYSKYEILDILSKCCDDKNKIIIYSIKNIINNKKEIFIPASKTQIPITEPRVILTRINTDKEIPYGAYEYLSWSMQLNRRIIIYVANSHMVNNLYHYLFHIKKRLTKNLFYYIKEDENKSYLYEFNHLKKSILITNDFGDDIIHNYQNIDIMVCFSEDKCFDYKKLMFFCGRVQRGENKQLSEVVFLCNKINENIEKVKDATRAFNEEAWKSGLLNI